jgi:2',3'-cyclic-nucleotide 2'-phosphodiesterase (5'-nucleotidase family)
MGVTDASGGGPLVDLAKQLSGFDAVLGNGNSVNFTASVNGARVVAGMNRGQAYGRTSLQYDRTAKRVTGAETTFVRPLVAAVTPDASIAAMLNTYRDDLAARLSETIVTTAVPIGSADACGNALARTCESLTGDVVTDAMRATFSADVALINSGALRAGLACPLVDSAADFCPSYHGLPAPITEGQVQAVLPFTNFVASVPVSGAELKAMLENGVSSVLEVAGRFPQVSGLCLWYDIGRPAGSRVVAAVRQAADGGCTGVPIQFTESSSYQLVTNDFVAAGGDGYPKPAANVTPRERLDLVLSRYLADKESISPRLQGRINCLGVGCPVLLEGAALPLPSGVGGSAGSSGSIVRPPATGDGGLR